VLLGGLGGFRWLHFFDLGLLDGLGVLGNSWLFFVGRFFSRLLCLLLNLLYLLLCLDFLDCLLLFGLC